MAAAAESSSMEEKGLDGAPKKKEANEIKFIGELFAFSFMNVLIIWLAN